MKLLLSSNVSLGVCLLLVLLVPVLSRAPRRENLNRLLKQMNLLKVIARGPFSTNDLEADYQHNLTALPRITLRARDFRNLQLNSTLLQLHSGLQSFQFHFDWLRQVHLNRSMNVPPMTQRIMDHLQLLQKQMENLPSNPVPRVPPQLPRLTSNWDIHTASVVVHQHLQSFCKWSVLALHNLMRKAL
ncbi:uncharacterized protein il11b [Alosa pseudoharengus]|uniref:uncharacterized protein il11b n=1 Tax=Alosa pseudoharengus TaxID=34774 RepID=UPI003F8C63FF